MYTVPTDGPASAFAARGVPREVRHLVSPFPDEESEGLSGFGGAEEIAAAGKSVGGQTAQGAAIGATVGSVVPVIGTAIGGAIGAAVGFASSFFGGGGGTANPASSVWKNIKPSDVLTLAALNVRVEGDGWHDASSGLKLSQEEADFRAESLMAAMIGARDTGIGSRGAWVDNADGHELAAAEAWERWTSTYGAGTTLETALRQGGGTPGVPFVPPPVPPVYQGAAPATPSWPVTVRPSAQAPGATPYAPAPYGAVPTQPTRTASLFAGNTVPLVIAGVALLAGVAMLSRRRGT